ncbi:Aldo/keto reductase [Streptoalloteichus tenebrarius]|uniref:Aldo/keto reductase n=1 Tax=Streptoalloteichus tenebrarius (strain ATCC 17920 / DSM 40477 / JCM 4838 / CBS 697.72 / NBRC 16177 / NCIMB 11028 / NRRL B-12390 / A12253. 1 / ISP 5477) TaxID=1933 RepID=A0ABT1HRR8_STRSD|nr:Aldo/keto reductase [Streptoalloteichus tenebrarius]
MADEVVASALACGVRLFDTASVYGRAEEALATALGDRQPEAFLATKIWSEDVAEGRAQLDRQLHRFGGHVDLIQVHNLIGWREHLPWLVERREAGDVGLVGVTYRRDHHMPGSGSRDDLVEAMRSGMVDVIQVPVNPLEHAVIAEVLPLAGELGLGVLAMRPFAEGELLPGPAPEDLTATGCATWAEALLRWTLSTPHVTAAIPATSSPRHVAANAAAGAAPPLTRQQWDLIHRLAR